MPPADPHGAAPGRRRFLRGAVAGAAVLGAGGAGALATTDSRLGRGASGPPQAEEPGPPAVQVVSTGVGSWQLLVRGQPWYVRGAAYGFPEQDAAQHIDDLAALGVNTVRTYSADPDTTAVLLDAAAARGMRVVVGFWLRQNADYRGGSDDGPYLESTMTDVVAVARAFTGHDGVLMWDVGNEVMGMTRSGSAEEVSERRAAYAAFVERLAVALHDADPRHPVTSTESNTAMWNYHRDHAPSLDLLAVNAYGGVGKVEGAWRAGGHDRPYLVTETGAAGDWEVRRGLYGVPQEGTDDEKADELEDAWRAVLAGGGASLGGTVFGYNSADTYIGMWRYLFAGPDRRPTWFALQRSLTGGGQERPLGLTVTPPMETDIPSGRSFSVGVDVRGGAAATATFEVLLFRFDDVRDTSYAVYGRRPLVTVWARRVGDNSLEVGAPPGEGTWKVYVVAKDGQGHAAVAPLVVRVHTA